MMAEESGKTQQPTALSHRTRDEEMRTRQEAQDQLRDYVLKVASFFIF